MTHENLTSNKIIINLEEVEVLDEHLSYELLAKMAYPSDPPAESSDIVYTITISHPESGDHTLARGDKHIKIKKGMVCNVRKTGRS